MKTRLGEVVNIRRPLPSILLDVIGIEDSINTDVLRATLTKFDERLESIKAIFIRENRVRTAVVRVPLSPGIRLLRTHKLKTGWSLCKLKELETNNDVCARCSDPGHMIKDCKDEVKRRFRCKEVGHLIASCKHPS